MSQWGETHGGSGMAAVGGLDHVSREHADRIDGCYRCRCYFFSICISIKLLLLGIGAWHGNFGVVSTREAGEVKIFSLPYTPVILWGEINFFSNLNARKKYCHQPQPTMDGAAPTPTPTPTPTLAPIHIDSQAHHASATFLARLHKYYSFVSPSTLLDGNYPSRAAAIQQKYGCMASNWRSLELKLQQKLLGKYGDEIIFEIYNSRKHDILLQGVAGGKVRDYQNQSQSQQKGVRYRDIVDTFVDEFLLERWSGKGTPPEESLDPTSTKFSPRALLLDNKAAAAVAPPSWATASTTTLSSVFNCRSLLPYQDCYYLEEEDTESRRKKEIVAGEKRKLRDREKEMGAVSRTPIADVMGGKANFVPLKEKNGKVKKSSLSILNFSAITTKAKEKEQATVRILLREGGGIRGWIVGTLLSIDKHWNIILNEGWVEVYIENDGCKVFRVGKGCGDELVGKARGIFLLGEEEGGGGERKE